MDAGTTEPGEVLDSGIVLDEEARRAALIDIDEAMLAGIEHRLDATREALAQFFAMPLPGREGTSVLRYQPGGFYRRHRDYAADVPWPGAALRRVAVVVFLNSARQEEADGAFDGGALWLYPEDEPAVEIRPRQGTLVAFPADTLHEVTTVTGGVRDALVDWFGD